MPIRWTLGLTPAERSHEVRAVEPRHLHAAACAVLEGPQAQNGHHEQRKPFVVHPPFAAAANPPLQWQLTWLSSEQASRQVRAGAEVRFGNQRMRVSQVEVEQTSWTALAEGPPVRYAELLFPTGATFSRDRRRHYPLPDPETMFAGLVRRWNAFAPAPLALAPDVTQAFLADLVLTGCDISTSEVVVGQGRRPVFAGTARIGVVGGSPEHVTVFGAMLRWAECAGVGALTTHGLGVVEVLTLER